MPASRSSFVGRHSVFFNHDGKKPQLEGSYVKQMREV